MKHTLRKIDRHDHREITAYLVLDEFGNTIGAVAKHEQGEHSRRGRGRWVARTAWISDHDPYSAHTTRADAVAALIKSRGES